MAINYRIVGDPRPLDDEITAFDVEWYDDAGAPVDQGRLKIIDQINHRIPNGTVRPNDETIAAHVGALIEAKKARVQAHVDKHAHSKP